MQVRFDFKALGAHVVEFGLGIHVAWCIFHDAYLSVELFFPPVMH